MRPSNNPRLAAQFRDEVLFHLEYLLYLPKAIVTAPQVSATVLTIHAWNRQTAAVFFDNGKFLVAYKLKPKSWWKLASVEDWKGTEADPYDFESIDPGSNVVVKEPKFFVYVTKDGTQTEEELLEARRREREAIRKAEEEFDKEYEDSDF